MATDYRKRISIPHNGSKNMELYSSSGELIATGYVRIVFGGRGPYIEFLKVNLNHTCMYIPKDLKWKMEQEHKDHVFYYELRTRKDYVKIYYQRKTVDYADYIVKRFYISPFDLYDSNGRVLIEKLNKKKGFKTGRKKIGKA